MYRDERKRDGFGSRGGKDFRGRGATVKITSAA